MFKTVIYDDRKEMSFCQLTTDDFDVYINGHDLRIAIWSKTNPEDLKTYTNQGFEVDFPAPHNSLFRLIEKGCDDKEWGDIKENIIKRLDKTTRKEYNEYIGE